MCRRIPVGKCPVCNKAVLYSDNPKDKNKFEIEIAEDGYKGQTYMCSRCKTMLAVKEKNSIISGYVKVPLINLNIKNGQSEPSSRQ